MSNVENKNPMDNNGYTPLHEAALNGHLEAFKYLFNIVEDKNPKSYHLRTPLDIVRDEGHEEIEQFIVQSLQVV